jgi:hypothetical protein
VFWDTPFGVTQASWDQALTDEDFCTVLQELKTVCTLPAWTIIAKCRDVDIGRFTHLLKEAKFNHTRTVVWYKDNYQQKGYSPYHPACEFFVHARVGGKEQQFNGGDANPLNRHNLFAGPSVLKLHATEAGDIINETQNPAWLMTIFCRRHLPHQGTALILGSGTGADVIGALAAGVHVVAVEKDRDQWDESLGIVNAAISDHVEQVGKQGLAAQEELLVASTWRGGGPKNLLLGPSVLAGVGKESDDEEKKEGEEEEEEEKTCTACNSSKVGGTKGALQLCDVCKQKWVHSKCKMDRSEGAAVFCSSACKNEGVPAAPDHDGGKADGSQIPLFLRRLCLFSLFLRVSAKSNMSAHSQR